MRQFVLCIYLLSIAAATFAQSGEQDAEVQAESPAQTELPQILIHEPNDFFRFHLLNGDGRIIQGKELEQMLLTVPENKLLIQQAKGLYAGMWSVLGITAAAFTIDILDACRIWPENQWVSPAMRGLMVIGLSSIVIMAIFRQAKYVNASDNYNVYVMGLPMAME